MGSFSSKPVSSDKRLVVVGTGLGGKSMAVIGEKAGLRVTAVERRSAVVYKVGMPLGLVDSSFGDQCLVPLQHLFLDKQRSTVKQGVVTSIDRNHVYLSDGSSIPFDYCVIAVGARSHSPCEPPYQYQTVGEMKGYFDSVRDAISSTQKIVLVGGGPVGIELAGAIRDKYANKEITIVHSGPRLCHAQQHIVTPVAFSDKLAELCAAKKINVRLNVRADLAGVSTNRAADGEIQLKLSDGTSLSCGLVIPCIGATPGGTELTGVPLDERGLIKVNEFLQVEGFSNVFAVGDCNNAGDISMAVIAGSKQGMGIGAKTGHCDVVLANIAAMESGGQANCRLQPQSSPFMAIPVGSGGKSSGAVVGVPGIMHGMVLNMKAKDYFLGVTRGIMHANARVTES